MLLLVGTGYRGRLAVGFEVEFAWPHFMLLRVMVDTAFGLFETVESHFFTLEMPSIGYKIGHTEITAWSTADRNQQNTNKNVAFFNFGWVAEWTIAAVLKTAVPKGTGGSNPSPSALRCAQYRNDSLG